VAPYEADAQLAFLSTRGMVDIVIAEDSDTIPYGCRRVSDSIPLLQISEWCGDGW
jgi:5'-3' exonuclease